MRDYYILVGESAKISSASGTQLEYGTNTSELFDGCTRARKVATAELNVTKLDGTYEWFDGNSNIGVWTKVADENGGFTNSPTITVIFSEPISFNCFKLCFGDTKPKYYTITFYDANGVKIFSYVNATNDSYDLGNYKNAKKAVITDIEMPPHQRFKLCEVLVGQDMEVFTSANIASCSISASYSPIGNEIPVDSMECALISDDMRFHALNTVSNESKKLKDKATVKPFVIDDYNASQLGTYYISTLDTSSGVQALITAESDLSEVSDAICDPTTMYNFPNLWYKSSGRKVSGYVRRNYTLNQILKIIGLKDYVITSGSISENTTMEMFAHSDNCRDLFQSVLLCIGATSYMRRDGKRSLLSTSTALSGTQSHSIDHTLGDISYTKNSAVNSIKFSYIGLASKFCTRQIYQSSDDTFGLEYKREFGIVTYEINFDDKFIPCAISVSTLDGSDLTTGRNVMIHHFNGVSQNLYSNLTDHDDNSQNNEFYITNEDITSGKLNLTVRQTSLMDSENTRIGIYGLMRFETEITSEFIMKISDGNNQIEINIPDFGPNFNLIEIAWKSFSKYIGKVNFETEKTVWIGENVTLPIAYENYSPEKILKRITASITDVSIDLCSGITKAKGVVKP